MYEPTHFREDDLDTLQGTIEAHPLGLLISSGETGVLANPVPFLLDRTTGAKGTLRCHLARANAQWQALAAGAEALVVFQGSQAYVTPSWYETKQETGKVVPTWNFVMVQARGMARIIEDAAWLHANVSALTAHHEGRRAMPWAVSDAPEAFVAAQLKGIVGVEIEIAELRGKFKASQNRPAADRAGVAAGLAADGADPEMIREVEVRGGL